MPSPPLSISQSLSPRIAVLTSDDVAISCEANGCRGLEELLRPWEGSTERVSILSSTLTPTIHPTFPLRFISYNAIYLNPASSAPNPDMVVDLINSFVAAKKPDDEQQYPLTRSLMLSSRQLASHETFQHPVGIVLAVSTSTPDPLGTLSRLYQQTMTQGAQGAPWMDGVSVMRFYVVVHDVNRMGADLTAANELLAHVKKAHGPHSTLLVINSRVDHHVEPPSPDVNTHPSMPIPRPFTPEDASPSAMSQVYATALSSLTLSPMAAASAEMENGNGSVSGSPVRTSRKKRYAALLTAEDTQRLVAVVRELVVQSLIPWMEGRIREWNEIYHSNRRGITGRLFGAGRKLFGSRPNSPSPNAMQAGYNATKGYYAATTIESLSRRLADFAFMLRDYKYASGVYDSLRKDYAQDRAWRHSAAATEMYGLSLLLSHYYFLPSTPPNSVSAPFTTLQHIEISSWLEQAVIAYHSHTPAMEVQTDAIRATILYYEAWKMIGEWRGVGLALVKSAGEADEVPNAVMIEEAAAADVKGGKSQNGRRRRAFHLVMAARRYETAGLKTYSRRCLDRASQIYRASPWTAAQDRIEYSLGRQAYTLGESDVAAEHFLRLLRKEDTGVHGSQGMLLEDLSLAYDQLKAHPDMLAGSKARLKLPTPIFDIQQTRLYASSSSSAGPSSRWVELEARALSSWDRKGKRPARLLPDDSRTIIGVDEECTVELLATNPLNAPLVLTDLSLTASPADNLTMSSIPELTLEAYETRRVSLTVSATAPTTFTILGVEFLFHRFFPYSQALQRQGKRLHVTKAQRVTPTYAEDSSLRVQVVPGRPSLSLQLIGLPEQAYIGEEINIRLLVSNTSQVPIDDLGLFAGDGFHIQPLDDTPQDDTPASIPNQISRQQHMSLTDVQLSPRASHTFDLVITPLAIGPLDLSGLLIFSAADDPDSSFGARFSGMITVSPILSVSTSIRSARHVQQGWFVGVDLGNSSQDCVKVSAVEAFSPYWRIDSSTLDGPEDETLHPNQSTHSVLSVFASPPPSVDLLQKGVIQRLSRLLQGAPPEDIPPVQHPALTPAACPKERIPGLVAARQSYRQTQLATSFPTLAQNVSSRLFPLWEPCDLDLVIRFTVSTPSQSGRPVRRGHVIAHSVQLAPPTSLVEGVRREVESALASGSKQTRTMYEETSRQRQLLMDSVLSGPFSIEVDPISLRLHVKGSTRGVWSHDFSTGPGVVKVDFVLQNRSLLLPCRWVLRLPVADPDDDNPARWSGNLRHQGTLQPGIETVVSCRLWVDSPGSVDLRSWVLETETGDEIEGEGEDVWRPRHSWVRSGQSGVVEVVNSSTVA